jgi:predicted RNA binding protein YcfA (HicA-like mRNA interferase family)
VQLTQLEKLISRIRARPPEADFGDVKRLLVEYGWELARQKGSHVIFTKPHERSITVPLVDGKRVKRTYLTEICERLGLDI